MAEPLLTASLGALLDKRQAILARTTAEDFASDAQRFARFHVTVDDLLFDYSKQRIDQGIIEALIALARTAGVEAKRDAMFRGDIVNTTEKRAALHTALRNFSGQPVMVDGH